MCKDSHVHACMPSMSTWVQTLVPINCSQRENQLSEWVDVVDDGFFCLGTVWEAKFLLAHRHPLGCLPSIKQQDRAMLSHPPPS